MTKYPLTISMEEMLEITETIGGDCYVLYLYYHSKGQSWKWRDEQIRFDLGWGQDKLARIRNKLKENGWMDIIKHSGDVFIYLGRKKVLGEAANQRKQYRMAPSKYAKKRENS